MGYFGDSAVQSNIIVSKFFQKPKQMTAMKFCTFLYPGMNDGLSTYYRCSVVFFQLPVLYPGINDSFIQESTTCSQVISLFQSMNVYPGINDSFIQESTTCSVYSSQ